MNKELMKAVGFEKEVKEVEAGNCPFCGEKIGPPSDFRDELSRREFLISGLCQKCQDKTFGGGDEG